MRQMSHLVVGAAKLEAKDGEEILPFQENATFQSVTEVDGVVEGGFVDHVVDSGGQDQAQVLLAMHTTLATASCLENIGKRQTHVGIAIGE